MTPVAAEMPVTKPRLRDAAKWAAVVARDAAFDGVFYFSVETTGVYCRPSCPARRPKRAHVRFHDSAGEAEEAGFRPCKRCRPDQPSLFETQADKVAQACRTIETAEQEPRLDDLARDAGLSPHHFHRIFKSMLGVTPKAYAAAHRKKRVRDALGKRATVTEAIFDAGFNAGSRFYAAAEETLGMTPRTFRSGGVDTEITFATRPMRTRTDPSRRDAQGRVCDLFRRRHSVIACRLAETVPACGARSRRRHVQRHTR